MGVSGGSGLILRAGSCEVVARGWWWVEEEAAVVEPRRLLGWWWSFVLLLLRLLASPAVGVGCEVQQPCARRVS